MTFFIALFVLVMQFLWKYIDDLAGKGLSPLILLELLVYASATLVPMAIPLANLLSSIMTMGNLAEHLEIVAAKSSGVSLFRLLRPLVFVSALTAVIAFLFSNYAMPVANYKLRAMLMAIQKQKPAIDIPEGEFYDGIKGLTVYVGEKGSDQRSLYNVILYDHTQENQGNSAVMVAESGAISVTDDENYLTFRLDNGKRYYEKNFYGNRDKGLQYFQEQFDTQTVIIDLRDLKFNKQDPSFIRNQYSMMDVGQLETMYGETEAGYLKTTRELAGQFMQTFSIRNRPGNPAPLMNNDLRIDPSNLGQAIQGEQVAEAMNDTTVKDRKIPRATFGGTKIPDVYNEEEKQKIRDLCRGQASVNLQRAKEIEGQEKGHLSNLARNRIEFWRKFTLSAACILLFFVGAPLGAIIRKGGLGWPLILSIIIFIIYYVISTVGEKSVRNMAMDHTTGMWLSTLVLAPIALFFTLKASTDSPMFMADTYRSLFRNTLEKIRRK